MLRLTTTAVIAASLVGIFVGDVAAHRRSIPIEVTGTITKFDTVHHRVTIHVDKPSSILMIVEGHDCKFTRNGQSTTEQALRQGARVKVSYFSTIFVGKIAVEIELDPGKR